MGKFYITTSIPYVNAPPHIGFSLEAIQADVLARHHRANGEDVFFLTGADEHGVKIVRTAEKAGKTPEELTDENSGKFRELTKVLNISSDDFIRTSDKKRHWPGAQKLWSVLTEAGDIYKKKYCGLYCVGHEAFVTDKDLESGVCAIHKTKPEIVEEENYFFRLSKYSEKIESLIKSNELVVLPDSRRNEILSLLKTGLEDVSFSRPSKDLSWGIPVPGDETQTMYVWCDALSNYITALGYGDSPQGENFRKYWPADIQVIGKDILRFHTAIWPGMLLSAGLLLPKTIWVHGFVTVGGEKMSKSLGNVVDPFELVEKYNLVGQGADALRYYLLREIPSGEDGDFTLEKFEERYNADLAKGLGNLVARVLTLAEKSNIESGKNSDFERAVKETREQSKKLLNDFKFNDALSAIWQLVALGNKYIDEKKPWTIASESEDFKETIGSLLFLISEIGRLLEPFLQETSEKIAEATKSRKSVSLFPRI